MATYRLNLPRDLFCENIGIVGSLISLDFIMVGCPSPVGPPLSEGALTSLPPPHAASPGFKYVLVTYIFCLCSLLTI